MENTKYTEEFKQSIVSLYESGKSSTQICKEYGMSSSTLHKWIKKYTKVQVSETETMTMAEIKKMQKKKQAAWFLSHTACWFLSSMYLALCNLFGFFLGF